MHTLVLAAVGSKSGKTFTSSNYDYVGGEFYTNISKTVVKSPSPEPSLGPSALSARESHPLRLTEVCLSVSPATILGQSTSPPSELLQLLPKDIRFRLKHTLSCPVPCAVDQATSVWPGP